MVTFSIRLLAEFEFPTRTSNKPSFNSITYSILRFPQLGGGEGWGGLVHAPESKITIAQLIYKLVPLIVTIIFPNMQNAKVLPILKCVSQKIVPYMECSVSKSRELYFTRCYFIRIPKHVSSI